MKHRSRYLLIFCMLVFSVSFYKISQAQENSEGHFIYHFISEKDEVTDYKQLRLEAAYSHWANIYGVTLKSPIDVYVYDRILDTGELKKHAGKNIVVDKYVPTLSDEAMLTDNIYYRDYGVQVGQIFMAANRGLQDRMISNSLAPWNNNGETVEFKWWQKGLLFFLKSEPYSLPSFRTINIRGRINSMSDSLRKKILNMDALSENARFQVQHITKNSLSEAFWSFLYISLDHSTFAQLVEGVTKDNMEIQSALKKVLGKPAGAVWSEFAASIPARGEGARKAEKYIIGTRFSQILDFSISPSGKYVAFLNRNVPGRESLSIREFGNNTFQHAIHRRKIFSFAWSTDEDKIYYQALGSDGLKKSSVHDLEKNKTKKYDDLSLINDFSMGFNDVAFGTDDNLNLCILKNEQRTLTCLTKDKPPDLSFFRPKSSTVQSIFLFATIKSEKLTNYVIDPATDKYSEMFSALDLVIDPVWTPSGECLYFTGHGNGFMDLYRFCMDTLIVEKSDVFFGDIGSPHTNVEGDKLFFIRHESEKDFVDKFPLAEITWTPISGRASPVTAAYNPGSFYNTPPQLLKEPLRWNSAIAAFPYFKPIPYGVQAGAGFDISHKSIGHMRGYAAWDSKLNGVDINVILEREWLYWKPRFEYNLSNTYLRATDSFWRRHIADFGLSWLPHPRTRFTLGARIEHIFFKDFNFESDSFSGPYLNIDFHTKPENFSLKPLPGFKLLVDAYMALDWNGSRNHPVINSDFNYTINPAGLIYDIGVHLGYTTHIDPNYRFYTFGGDLGYLIKKPYPGVIGLPYQQFLGQHAISINQEFWLPIAAVNRGISSDYFWLGDIYVVGLFDIGWPDFTRDKNYKSFGAELRLLTKIMPYLPLRISAGYHRSFDGFGNKFYWSVRSDF